MIPNTTQRNAVKKKKKEERKPKKRTKMEKQLREEEEQCSPRRVKAQCIPRLRAPVATSSSCSARSHRFAPSSLLERFREAVFRLMMLSALSKSSTPPPPQPSRHRPYYPVNDPYHSEAVADCIEFINRKKQGPDAGEGRGDTAAAAISGGPLEAPSDMVMPVPVM